MVLKGLFSNHEKTLTIYQAFKGFEKQLIAEIGSPQEQIGDLMIYKHKMRKALWAKNIWGNTKIIAIDSISDGARKLRSLGKIWIPYHHKYVRRGTLIQEKLKTIPLKRLNFLDDIPETALNHWTLLGEHTILASINCSSSRPYGDWEFNEDKTNPPSRAYLKLWELFTRFGFTPNKKEVCLELGAAPGGWTWVLSALSKKVITFDRAALDPKIEKLPNVTHHIHDAFSAIPANYPEVDWVFSDLICAPEKLYHWLTPWLEDNKKRKFCLTVKLKDDAEGQKWIEKFRAIPHGRVLHLYHNKHEVTFIKGDKDFFGKLRVNS